MRVQMSQARPMTMKAVAVEVAVGKSGTSELTKGDRYETLGSFVH